MLTVQSQRSSITSTSLRLGIVGPPSRMRELALLHLAADGIVVSATGVSPTDPAICGDRLEVVLLCLGNDRWLEDVRVARAAIPSAALIAIRPDDAKSDAARGLRAGVSAIVREPALTSDLVLAIWALRAGMVCIPRAFRDSLQTEHLSGRERQILSLVVSGMTNAAIAGALHVTESTVKSHLSSAYTKLGARTRKEATALFHNDGTLTERLAPSNDVSARPAALGSLY